MTLELQRDERGAVVTVTDTGEGIDPQFLPRMFDVFVQADQSSTRSAGGLGLALAIVRHLVQQHGGTMSATSPGKDSGSAFTVRLPLLSAGLCKSSPT